MKFIKLAIFFFTTFAVAAPTVASIENLKPTLVLSMNNLATGSPDIGHVPDKEQDTGDVMLEMLKGGYWDSLPEKLDGPTLEKVMKDLGGDLVHFISAFDSVEAPGSLNLQASKGESDIDATAIKEKFKQMKSLTNKQKRDFIGDFLKDFSSEFSKVASAALFEALIIVIVSML